VRAGAEESKRTRGVAEVKGSRTLRKWDLLKFQSSLKFIRMIKRRWVERSGHVARVEKRNVCRILVREAEGKTPEEVKRGKRENNTGKARAFRHFFCWSCNRKNFGNVSLFYVNDVSERLSTAVKISC
jgi:hypothetical protein